MPTLYDNFSQVRQYIDENNTSYVSKTELANASYVTSSQLSDCSYATTSYVADYVATYGGGVIDENIIPKENNTYTLGDSSYMYAATYTYAVYYNTNNKIYNTANSGLVVQRAGTDICGFLGGANIGIAPLQSNSKLGNSSMLWQSTYTSNIWLNSNLKIAADGSSSTLVLTQAGDPKYSIESTAIHPYGAGNNEVISLGTSTRRWLSTYTRNIYANNAYISNYNNLIWTGTAAEYSALADYTTYNLYLIQES